MFDQAICFFGVFIENCCNERVDVGGKSVTKYSLEQLLTPGFVIDGDTGDGDELPTGVDGVIYDEVG